MSDDAKHKPGPKSIYRGTPEQIRAAGALHYQIKLGNIIRPSICEECGANNKKIEAAHFNYEEPLRVRWLCHGCHQRWDRDEPKGGAMLIVRHPGGRIHYRGELRKSSRFPIRISEGLLTEFDAIVGKQFRSEKIREMIDQFCQQHRQSVDKP